MKLLSIAPKLVGFRLKSVEVVEQQPLDGRIRKVIIRKFARDLSKGLAALPLTEA